MTQGRSENQKFSKTQRNNVSRNPGYLDNHGRDQMYARSVHYSFLFLKSGLPRIAFMRLNNQIFFIILKFYDEKKDQKKMVIYLYLTTINSKLRNPVEAMAKSLTRFTLV